jgi:N-acetylglucosaminyldiphosphoundecaprenol N-acetyl-beta-D-mannosaminyltransferase
MTEHGTVDLMGMSIDRMDRWQLLDHMFDALERREGGWVITANLDFLRRHAKDPHMRSLYDDADIRVADGMPLVWAARLQGDALPERVAGSSLVTILAERAAAEGRSIYLLGGDPGAAEGCRDELVRQFPKLNVCGLSNPWFSNPPTREELDATAAELDRCEPDIVLVGLGSPKQELVIQGLRDRFGGTWMIGVGLSFSFVAGLVRRAPPLLRRWGMEWIHRLAQEPRRLARRYLMEDLPFAVELFATTLVQRRTRRQTGARRAS